MLEVILGCMYASKSGTLLDRMLRADLMGLRCVLLKPELDDRYATDAVVTHGGFSAPAFALRNVADLEHHARTAEVFGVDEVQFLPEAMGPALDALASSGYRVIVAGLDMDFLNEPFPITQYLSARADRVDKLLAVCESCRKETATRSQLVHEGVAVTTAASNVLVGGKGLFEARCRWCFEHEGKRHEG